MHVPELINYDHRLPLPKQDVIFVARLIIAGKDVVMDQRIHCEDKTIPTGHGGCRGKLAIMPNLMKLLPHTKWRN